MSNWNKTLRLYSQNEIFKVSQHFTVLIWFWNFKRLNLFFHLLVALLIFYITCHAEQVCVCYKLYGSEVAASCSTTYHHLVSLWPPLQWTLPYVSSSHCCCCEEHLLYEFFKFYCNIISTLSAEGESLFGPAPAHSVVTEHGQIWNQRSLFLNRLNGKSSWTTKSSYSNFSKYIWTPRIIFNRLDGHRAAQSKNANWIFTASKKWWFVLSG